MTRKEDHPSPNVRIEEYTHGDDGGLKKITILRLVFSLYSFLTSM